MYFFRQLTGDDEHVQGVVVACAADVASVRAGVRGQDLCRHISNSLVSGGNESSTNSAKNDWTKYVRVSTKHKTYSMPGPDSLPKTG